MDPGASERPAQTISQSNAQEASVCVAVADRADVDAERRQLTSGATPGIEVDRPNGLDTGHEAQRESEAAQRMRDSFPEAENKWSSPGLVDT